MVKGKGSAFEREICVKLSEWVSGGARRDVFWRTAMSGGRATVFKKKGALLRQSGDITAVAFEGHDLTDKYYFELKHYRDLGLLSFFLRKGGLLCQFWSKTQEEAKHYNMIPIMIVRQNLMPTLWIMKKKDCPTHWLSHTAELRIDVRHRGCVIYRFDDIMRSSYRKPAITRERI